MGTKRMIILYCKSLILFSTGDSVGIKNIAFHSFREI